MASKTGKKDEIKTIFFARSGKSGPIKIGFSKNPTGKIKQLQAGNPEFLKIIRRIQGTRQNQQDLIGYFYEKYSLRGEWFIFCEEMMTISVEEAEGYAIDWSDKTGRLLRPDEVGYDCWEEEAIKNGLQ